MTARRTTRRTTSAMLNDLGTRRGTERVLNELFGTPDPRCEMCGATIGTRTSCAADAERKCQAER